MVRPRGGRPVLRGHQGLSQCPPGEADDVAARRLRPVLVRGGAERPDPGAGAGDLGLRRGPRPPAAGPGLAPPGIGIGYALALALPHRPDQPVAGHLGRPLAPPRPVRPAGVLQRGVRARRPGSGPHRAGPAVHRPVPGEEPADPSLGGRRGPGPLRHRRPPALPAPGLAFRPLEGPPGRAGRVPSRPGGPAGHAAGVHGRHGGGRPGRVVALPGDAGGGPARTRTCICWPSACRRFT